MSVPRRRPPRVMRCQRQVSEFEVHLATSSDIPEWLDLAKSVEHLFGPMIGHGFEEALAANIGRKSAFCVKNTSKSSSLCGGLIFDLRESPIYHMRWLAVLRGLRQRCIGKLLLSHAIALTSFCPEIRILRIFLRRLAAQPSHFLRKWWCVHAPHASTSPKYEYFGRALASSGPSTDSAPTPPVAAHFLCICPGPCLCCHPLPPPGIVCRPPGQWRPGANGKTPGNS